MFAVAAGGVLGDLAAAGGFGPLETRFGKVGVGAFFFFSAATAFLALGAVFFAATALAFLGAATAFFAAAVAFLGAATAFLGAAVFFAATAFLTPAPVLAAALGLGLGLGFGVGSWVGSVNVFFSSCFFQGGCLERRVGVLWGGRGTYIDVIVFLLRFSRFGYSGGLCGARGAVGCGGAFDGAFWCHFLFLGVVCWCWFSGFVF